MAAAIVPFLTFVETANAQQAMSFRISTPDGSCAACTLVYAEGAIEPDTPDRFISLVQSENLQPGTTIVFNSPGGSLAGGIELGRLIRARRLHTAVFAAENHDGSRPVCASACTYAFLGGAHRTASSDALIGLHQFSSRTAGQQAFEDAQTIMASLAGYVREMGGSPQIIEIASGIRPQEIHWLSASRLIDLRITTSRGTRFEPAWSSTDWRRPAIRVEQLLDGGQVSAISISCGFDPARDASIGYRGPQTYSVLITLPNTSEFTPRDGMPVGAIWLESDSGSRWPATSPHRGYQTSITNFPRSPTFSFSAHFSHQELALIGTGDLRIRWSPTLGVVSEIRLTPEGFDELYRATTFCDGRP